ncbi:hypothetical protein BKA70DRAFT_1564517 [Coprinopsis sp. MPI-PUGE-AT-0042]|nr:hypothetical protein BKA70DRAFT_1564517 [Coprinopsis sp. MPI-PUGE-AT-0042]
MIHQVPPEIAFHIIDCLEGDDLSIKNTSLVCQTWQHHSQQSLFRTFALTVHLGVDGETVRRLEEFASASSTRISDYICTLTLTFPRNFSGAVMSWMSYHEELIVRVLRRLTCLTITNAWMLGRHMLEGPKLRLRLPSLAGYIQELCASPILKSVTISGVTPFLRLLPCCGPSLKQLHATSLGSLCMASYRRDHMPPERPTPIHLEVLTMQHTSVNSDGLSDYLLDPLSLFSLRSLKRLEVHNRGSFDTSLCSLLKACVNSLKVLTLTVDSSHPPQEGLRLGLQNAPKLRKLDFYVNDAADVRLLLELIEWVLLDLTDQPIHRNCEDKSLANVTFELPAESLIDMAPTIHTAFSKFHSDMRFSSTLKDVNVHFVPSTSSASLAEESISRYREGIYLSGPSMEKSVICLQWR